MAGYGMHGSVQINYQNSYGTLQTTSLEALPIVSETLELSIDQITQNTMYGRFAESATIEGAQTIQGDLTIEAEPQVLGYFLNAFCSNETAPTSGSFEHSFKMAQNDFDERAAGIPFTCEVYRDVGSAFIYYDLLANTFELSVANGELLTSTLGILGAGYSRQAAGSPTYPSGATNFKWDQSSVTYDGSAFFDLRDITISGNKNLQGVWTLTESTAPYKIKRSDFETFEISGTLLYQSDVDGTLFDDFEAQSEKRLTINFASNSPNNLFIDIPSFKFTSLTPVMDGADIIEAAFTARAEYNAGSDTQIEFKLTNVRTLAY